MKYLLLILLAASAHAAPLVGTQDLQPAVSVSSLAVGTTTISTVTFSVYGIDASSTTSPTVACTLGTPVMTAGSTSQSGSYAAGTGATGCTVTFTMAWNKAPFCSCQASANLLVYASASAKNSVTCTSATAMTGDTITYFCWGPP